MISEEQYNEARQQVDQGEAVIAQFHSERARRFRDRMESNPIFTDDELFYSATTLCPCGHGLAYPKDCGPHHYWDCSAILKGVADPAVKHTDRLPFVFYDVKGESERRGSTRGVFRPKPADEAGPA